MITSQINDFNSGELSPYMSGRKDLKQYHKGCETIENALVVPWGGVNRISGSKYVSEFPDTYGDHLPRLKEFIFSEEENVCLVFGHKFIRFIINGELVTRDFENWASGSDYKLGDLTFFAPDGGYIRCIEEHTSSGASPNYDYWEEVSSDDTAYQIPSVYEYKKDAVVYDSGETYSDGDLVFDTQIYESLKNGNTDALNIEASWKKLDDYGDLYRIQFAQSADVIFMAHPDYPRQKLSRTEKTAPHFKMEEMDDDNVPFRELNLDESLNLVAGYGAIGDEVSIYETSDNSVFSSDMVGAYLKLEQKNEVTLLEQIITATETISDTMQIYGDYQFTTHGNWEGEIQIRRRKVGETEWEILKSYTSYDNGSGNYSNNYRTDGTEDEYGYEYAIYIDIASISGDAYATLTKENFYNKAIYKITDYYAEDDVDAEIVQNQYISYTVDYTDLNTDGTEVEVVTAGHTLEEDDYVYLEKSTGYEISYSIVKVTGVSGNNFNISVNTGGAVIDGTGTVYQLNPTDRWAESAWSDKNGYPRSILLFEERLWYGGTDKDPQTIWASRTNNYYDYELGNLATHALEFTIASNQLNDIQWLNAQSIISIGTKGGEWTLKATDEDEAISATNFQLQKQTTYGSDYLQSLVVNDSTLFFQKEGKIMRELAYNFENDGYVAPDLTLLAEHITGEGVLQFAYQSQPYTVVWCVTKSGHLACLVYNRNRKIVGWSRLKRKLDSEHYSSVAVVPTSTGNEDVYVTVTNDSGSSAVEVFQFNQKYTTENEFFGNNVDLHNVVYLNSWYEYKPKEGLYNDSAYYQTVDLYDSSLKGLEIVYIEEDEDKIKVRIDTDDFDLSSRYFYAVKTNFVDKRHLSSTWQKETIEDISGGYIEIGGDGSSFSEGDYVIAHDFTGSDELTTSHEGLILLGDRLSRTVFQMLDSVTGNPIDMTGWTPYSSGGYLDNRAIIENDSSVNEFADIDYVEDEIDDSSLPDWVDDYDAVFADGIYFEDDIPDGYFFNRIVIGKNYDTVIKTMPLSPSLEYGTTQGRKKKIAQCILRIKDSNYFKVSTQKDNYEVSFNRKGNDSQVEPMPFETAIRRVKVNSSYEDDVSVYIKQDKGYPLELLNIATLLEVYR